MKAAILLLACASLLGTPGSNANGSAVQPMRVLVTNASPNALCGGIGTVCQCAVGTITHGVPSPQPKCSIDGTKCIDVSEQIGTGGRVGCCKPPDQQVCTDAAIACTTPNVTLTVTSAANTCTLSCCGVASDWQVVGNPFGKTFGQNDTAVFNLTAACNTTGMHTVVVQCVASGTVLFQNTWQFHCDMCTL